MPSPYISQHARSVPFKAGRDPDFVDNPGLLTAKNVQNAIEEAALFGSNYQYADSNGDSTTTSSSFQQKLRLTTTDLPNKDYVIYWSAELKNDEEEESAQIRVQIDDTTTIAEQGHYMKDDADTYRPCAGFFETTLSGVTNIDLDFRKVNNGTAEVRRARLAVWRVE